jgi:gliding motility-associated-like protein
MYLLTRCLLLVTIAFSFMKGHAGISIDSVRTTNNTCTNNGAMIVFAHTNAPPIFYSITDGPSVSAIQSSGTFSSLEPGVYKIQVSDMNGDSAIIFAAISGSYTFPDFSLDSRAPTCSRSTDGLIAITSLQGTGNGNIVWRLKDMATQQTSIIQPDTIKNLPPGSYMVSATDACGNSTNKPIQVYPGYSYLFIKNSPMPKISKTACNAVTLETEIEGAYYDLFLPIQLTITTKNGTITKTANIINGNLLQETIPNMDYGDSINLLLVNNCSDSFSTIFNLPQFDFSFTPSWDYINCAKKYTGGTFSFNSGWYEMAMKNAVDFKLYATATGMVVESGVLNNASSVHVYAHPPGKTYNIQITDGCGRVFRDTFFWSPIDSLLPAGYHITSSGAHCLDSTAGVYIFPHDFPTRNVSCVLLSGPSYIGSTKPGFAYHDTIQYNKLIPSIYGNFQLSNLAPGTYRFMLYDDCGHSFIDSFSILPEQTADDNYMLKVVPGCEGQNNLQLHFFSRKDTAIKSISNTYGEVTITNMQTGQKTNAGTFSFATPYRTEHLLNISSLNSGNYSVQIDYKDPFAANNQQAPYLHKTCQSFTTTVNIAAYTRPRIRIFNKINCKGSQIVELQADSSRGVFPLQYEIISGPAIYPIQSGNLFQLQQPGTYVARVTDTCGNANTYSFTTDTFSFPLITKTGSSCTGGITKLGYPSSPFFTYRWKRPDGSSFTGDTLLINPTTANDLGLYYITKIVNFNGCVDSFTTTYTLNPNKIHYTTDTLCPGQQLQVGTHTYTQSGIYRDTLFNAICDSIVITYLTVDYKRTDTSQTICAGKTFTFKNQQLSATGIYRDTTDINGCATITTLSLQVTDYARGSELPTICDGENYAFGNSIYTTMGIYRDTIRTTGCDSIHTLYLIVKDYVKGYDSAEICAGSSVKFGNRILKDAGIYHDTLATSGCDSVVTFLLKHKPYPSRDIDTSICAGQKLQLWNNTYTAAGKYTDTLATNECDTIFHITLLLNPTPQGDTSLQLYETEYEHPLELHACAHDTFYQWTDITCNNCPTVTVSPQTELSQYTCKVSNIFGCSTTCRYEIKVNGIFGRLYRPNVFSPNGDGSNDLFRIFGKAIHQNYLEIFDRWGQLVFYGNDPATGWDGNYKGEPVPAGVYVYVFNYFSGIAQQARSVKGSVTLVR